MKLNGVCNQNFNGIYVVRGKKDKVDEFKQSIEEQTLGTKILDIDLGKDKKASIVAANFSTMPKEKVYTAIKAPDLDRTSQKGF